LGIENGWVQELESAENYRPDFTDEEPFPERRNKKARRKERAP
jgi:hypothetical protein